MLRAYRFRPGWFKTLVVALLLPVLVGLGFWQLDRAQQKTAIRDSYRARSQMSPLSVNRTGLDPANMAFRRATVRGHYRDEFSIYLDNRVRDGVPGYEILTPLRIEGRRVGEARYILVNRGWIPWGESRQRLPRIDTPEGALDISGWLRAPAEDYFTLADDTGNRTFQPRWQNLDLERYRQVTGLSASALVFELAPGEQGAGGLDRRVPEYKDAWIARHKAYALQWFSMALILAVLYVVLNFEKRHIEKRNPDHE